MRPVSDAVLFPHVVSRMLTALPRFSQGYSAEVHGTKATAFPSTTLAFRPGLDRALWTHGLLCLQGLDYRNGIVQPRD